ncbi:putative transcription factor WRKY family [Helianthus annuus]|nr:putative transcription factor WRKY family [Helianthus annuus]KAJ0829550.1 putative transcription factor WRKY family [Helianthus annuus]
MESPSWPESLPSNRIKAMQELTQGQVLMNKLQEMLGQPEKIEFGYNSVDDTLVQIVGMFNKTLSILSSNSPNFNMTPQNRTHDMSSPNNWDDQRSENFIESVKTVMPIKTKRGCHKRRKSSSIFTKVTSTLIDDGYTWRKYGEKVIINSKYQRHYYRCTHKFEQGCQATKQVQKTDDEPPMYRTTYHRHHTCKNSQREHQIILDSPNSRDSSVLFSFETNTIINRKQVRPFSSSTKHKPEEGFSCLSVDYNKVSLSNYNTTWDQVTQSIQIPLEPKSMMSSGLDHEDMVSPGVYSSTCSTHQYETKDVFRSNDISDF